MRVDAAQHDDWAGIEALLRSAGLSDSGVDGQADWLVVRHDGRIAGTAAVEAYGASGLLRSVAVDAAARGGGAGASVVRAAIGRARERGLSELYLLTETADGWFPRFGFAPIARTDLPPAIAGCRQATEACSSTAVTMRLPLRQDSA